MSVEFLVNSTRISKNCSFFRILSEFRILGSDTNSNIDFNVIRILHKLRQEFLSENQPASSLITISMWSAKRMKKVTSISLSNCEGINTNLLEISHLKFFLIPVGLLQTPSEFQKDFQFKTS